MNILIPFAAIAALLPLVPAGAETPARSEIVRFGYPEVASADGRAALDRRIHRAAEAVCGTAFDFDLAGQNKVRRCRKETVATASRALVQTLAERQTELRVAANP